MTPMDAYVRMPDPGDTVTLMVTGTLRDLRPLVGASGIARVEVPGGAQVTAPLPGQPGVRLLPGDATPMFMRALGLAIEHMSKQDPDPEWVAPETLDEIDLFEWAMDRLRGYVPGDE